MKTTSADFVFEMPQDLPGDATTASACSHEHSLNLGAPLSDRPERPAAHYLIRFPGNHKISAGLLELGNVNPIDGQPRIKRGNFSVQLANQLASFIDRWAYGDDHDSSAGIQRSANRSDSRHAGVS